MLQIIVTKEIKTYKNIENKKNRLAEVENYFFHKIVPQYHKVFIQKKKG